MSASASTPEPCTAGTVTLPTLEQLPDDAETLKRMILELLATLLQERRDKDELRQRLDLLLRRLYGPRTEHCDPSQLLLFGATAEAGNSEPTAQPTPAGSARRRAAPHGRRLLPENLQRREVHHTLTEAERVCSCGRVRQDIGSEQSEQLDWQPASLFVWQHHVHKYACPHCLRQALTEATAQPGPSSTPTPAPAGPIVIAAAKPAQPIDKGLPGPGLLANLIVNKYVDHLPLHRQ